ncbi:MAG: hypothetical protein E7240_06170 [Lachnospiraceae bacterium]|nr:hypothetical protein [Lachnospiraceae bacterium]
MKGVTAMKKRILIALILVIAILMTACGKKKKQEYEANVSNPFTDYETLAEAEAAAGVAFAELPTVEGYDQLTYRASENEMLEVIYKDAKDKEGLRIRKAKGSADISGDYNEYKEQTQIILEQFVADLKGNDGKTGVVTWTETVDGANYAYSINVGEAEIDQVAATQLVSAVSEAAHIPVPTPTPEEKTVDGAEIEAGSPLVGFTFKVVNKSMKVKADLLNARQYPLDVVAEADSVTQLDNGTVIDVVYESNEWSAFWFSGEGGQQLLWVKTEYLEPAS